MHPATATPHLFCFDMHEHRIADLPGNWFASIITRAEAVEAGTLPPKRPRCRLGAPAQASTPSQTFIGRLHMYEEIKLLATMLAFAPALLSAQELRVFPPPPPVVSPIQGAIDFHVHSAPDVFGRSVTDIEAATLAKRMGLRGIVLKNHVTSTADRAAIVREVVPGIEVFGGIVLNMAVGGVNPQAVEWMARMSGRYGKVVWLPTIDADQHLKTFHEPGAGLKVAVDGHVTAEAEAVLKIIAREKLVLCTGHVSPAEVLAVTRRAI